MDSWSSVRKKILALSLLLVALAAAGNLVWTLVTESESSPDEEAKGLVPVLVESVAATREDSSNIRVALFCLNADKRSGPEVMGGALDSDSKCLWTCVSSADIRAAILSEFDVVVFPGGSGSEMAHSLAADGCEAVRDFVSQGGGYVGICGGAFLATAKYDWSLGLVNAKTLTGMREIPGQGMQSMASRGGGVVKMELTDYGRQVFGSRPGLFDVNYGGGPVLSPGKDRTLPPYVPLAIYRTEVWKYELQRNTMVDTPAILAARFDQGRVILFSPHPELSEGLEGFVTTAVRAVAPAAETE